MSLWNEQEYIQSLIDELNYKEYSALLIKDYLTLILKDVEIAEFYEEQLVFQQYHKNKIIEIYREILNSQTPELIHMGNLNNNIYFHRRKIKRNHCDCKQ